MNNILIDTCFWYALFDARDSNHHKALELEPYLGLGNIILPYPTLYETINTRFTRNKDWVEEFGKILKNKNVQIIQDLGYKEDGLVLTMDSILNKNRPISLVDMVIRLMLEDINLKINYFITFNTKDFIDICHKKRIELVNE